jgi:uncharacterized membrane protein YgcG
MASAFSAYHGATNPSQYTVTAMGRWSVLNKSLPAAEKIKSLHVYDFDNTLFKTPLPNPALWNGPTIGVLSNQETFVNGGWWHDNRILASTGEGLEKEEPRAWEGWWNEKIVELVHLSIKQPDALCVLLTGRSEHGFGELVKRMVASKGLEFDMVSLKPKVSPTNQRFSSTMQFKQLFLTALVETYTKANEIKVYEDRPKHTKVFREFFAEYNRRQNIHPTRGPLTADVVQVADISTTLDPVIEVAEIQHMINHHNEAILKETTGRRRARLRIKKTVFFTSYMIGPEASEKLLSLAPIPPNTSDHELKFHGNNILICPRPCPPSILERVGGMGSKLMWEVTGIGSYDNSIWAARVRPVPPSAPHHTDNPVPLVVLALRRGARPADAGKINNWKPISAEQAIKFEASVGEKVILRIENDDPKEDPYESLFANKAAKRKHTGDEDRTAKNTHGHGHYGGRNETRGYHTGRGGGGQGRGRGGNTNRGSRGGGRGGGRGGRGRGGYNYKSLDDVDPKNNQTGAGYQVDYDDSFPPINNFTQARGSGPNQQGRGGYHQQQSQGRPMGGQGSNGTDLQNFY